VNRNAAKTPANSVFIFIRLIKIKEYPRIPYVSRQRNFCFCIFGMDVD
jgi:hypothetical protein